MGEAFLARTVRKILNSAAWKKNSIIVIAWDEDDYNGYPTGCCSSPTGTAGTFGNILGSVVTPLIVVRSGEPAHRQATRPYNHYTLLATILRLSNLPCLGSTCSMTDDNFMFDLFGDN